MGKMRKGAGSRYMRGRIFLYSLNFDELVSQRSPLEMKKIYDNDTPVRDHRPSTSPYLGLIGFCVVFFSVFSAPRHYYTSHYLNDNMVFIFRFMKIFPFSPFNLSKNAPICTDSAQKSPSNKIPYFL